jgi:dihydropteroate synthase
MEIPLVRPLVVGIVNATPDSFSDGGQYLDPDRALAHASRLVDEGADMIDVGGESTRPRSAVPVEDAEQIRRVVPIIERLRHSHSGLPISVDTTSHGVARVALRAGASIINDVSGLRLDPLLGAIVADYGAGLVLMHSRGGISDMASFAHATYSDDVAGEVIRELGEAVDRATSAGVPRDTIVLDPGIGFSKRSEHSLSVLAELPRVAALGFPVLVGVSRKRFIGEITRVDEPAARVAGTVGANVAALFLGARLFRVHDVRSNREALDVAWHVARAAHNTDAVSGSRFPVPGSR